MAKVQLTGERATLLATLYGRALDARSPRSILHDAKACEAVEQIDFDFTKTGMRPGDETAVALRARLLDGWASEYLDAHPETTVLHLGCGLDTRVDRLDPGPAVRWIDVDYPDVIDLRHQIYPARDGYRTIGSSVTDLSWLGEVPGDLPALVVAEGLLMYLPRAEGRAMVERIVHHFPSGQFVFDALSRFGIKLQRLNKAVQAAGAIPDWGIDGQEDFASIDPSLRCLDALSAFDRAAYGADFDRLRPDFRLSAKAAAFIPALRRTATYYRFAF